MDSTCKFIKAFWEMLKEDIKSFVKDFHGIGVGKEQIEKYVDILNCRLRSIPFTYLGLPIGSNPRKFSMCELIVRKFERKLSTRKHQYHESP